MAATYTKFRDVIIKDFLGKPEEAELATLEAQLQAPLPDSYKSFLAVANGGNLDGYYVDIEHPEMTVPRSFSLLYGTRRRLESSPFGVFDHEIALSREAAQLPPQVLPIARDNSGCELYLDLTDFESLGEDRVVAFVHGIPDLENQPADNTDYTDRKRILQKRRQAEEQSGDQNRFKGRVASDNPESDEKALPSCFDCFNDRVREKRAGRHRPTQRHNKRKRKDEPEDSRFHIGTGS